MRSLSTRSIILSCSGILALVAAYGFGWVGGDRVTMSQMDGAVADGAKADGALASADNISADTPIAMASQSEAHLDKKAHFQWAMNCQGCHGPNGKGSPERGVPTMVDVVSFQKIQQGREFLVRVPGVARAPISDEDMTHLLNWMVRKMGTPAQTDTSLDFSQEEVTKYRKRPLLNDLASVREKLIAEIK